MFSIVKLCSYFMLVYPGTSHLISKLPITFLFVQFRWILTQTAILVLQVEKRVLFSILGKLPYNFWYNIAGNFFPTARARLIGYFEVTLHLTVKLFPAKISKQATLQNLWHRKVTAHCYPRMLTDDRCHSEVYWISSVKISSYMTNHFKTGPSGNS